MHQNGPRQLYAIGSGTGTLLLNCVASEFATELAAEKYRSGLARTNLFTSFEALRIRVNLDLQKYFFGKILQSVPWSLSFEPHLKQVFQIHLHPRSP